MPANHAEENWPMEAMRMVFRMSGLFVAGSLMKSRLRAAWFDLCMIRASHGWLCSLCAG